MKNGVIGPKGRIAVAIVLLILGFISIFSKSIFFIIIGILCLFLFIVISINNLYLHFKAEESAIKAAAEDVKVSPHVQELLDRLQQLDRKDTEAPPPQAEPYVRDKKGKSVLKLTDDYVVIDVETTGLDPQMDRLLEIAAVKVVNNEIVDEFITFINPGCHIPSRVTKINHITDAMVCNAPKIEEVLPRFYEFIAKFVLVGHNVNFDINFIYDASISKLGKPLSNAFIDTLRFSRRLFKDFENHKLCTLVENFCIETGELHRALSDCYATKQCYEHIKNYILDNNLEYGRIAPKKVKSVA